MSSIVFIYVHINIITFYVHSTKIKTPLRLTTKYQNITIYSRNFVNNFLDKFYEGVWVLGKWYS